MIRSQNLGKFIWQGQHLFDTEGHLFEMEGHLFDREGHLFERKGHLFWEGSQFFLQIITVTKIWSCVRALNRQVLGYDIRSGGTLFKNLLLLWNSTFLNLYSRICQKKPCKNRSWMNLLADNLSGGFFLPRRRVPNGESARHLPFNWKTNTTACVLACDRTDHITLPETQNPSCGKFYGVQKCRSVD